MPCSPTPFVLICVVRTELVNAEDQDWLVDLESEDFRLNQGKRLSVDLDETLSGLYHIVSIPSIARSAVAVVVVYLAVSDSCW
jgi:hypothetical protein